MKLSEIGDGHLFVHHDNPRFVYVPHLKSGYTSVVSALIDAFPAMTVVREESQLGAVPDYGGRGSTRPGS